MALPPAGKHAEEHLAIGKTGLVAQVPLAQHPQVRLLC